MIPSPEKPPTLFQRFRLFFTVQNGHALLLLFLALFILLAPTMGTAGFLAEKTNGVINAYVISGIFIATGAFLLARPQTPVYLMVSFIPFVLFSFATFLATSERNPSGLFGSFIVIIALLWAYFGHANEKIPL